MKPVYKLMDPRGRVHIPKAMRDALELDCGDFVKLLMGRNGLQLQKVHLIEVGDQSPEAVEAYVQAAVAVMSKDKQMELASRLLAQLRKEEIL